MLSFGGLNGGVTVGWFASGKRPTATTLAGPLLWVVGGELPHLQLRTDQSLFVCHAALQLPTQVQDGAFFFIVLQCRIMARLAVGMGKREGNGGRVPPNSFTVTLNHPMGREGKVRTYL